MGTPSVNGGFGAEAYGGLMRINNPNTITFLAYVAIGASGAATVYQNGSSAAGPITCVKNTTGTYDVTYPAFATASTTSLAHLKCRIVLSAAATVASTYVKAFAPTSGTAQIITYLNTAGTPVEPANGDAFVIEVVGTNTGMF